MTDQESQGRGAARAARRRALRDPESVGRRLGEGPRQARLQGAGDDQRRLCLHARAHRRRGHPRRALRTRQPRSTRRPTLPVSVDLENGFGPEPADAANAITRAAAAGAVGGSIEDFDHERGPLRRRARDRASRRRGRGCARARLRRSRSRRAPRTTCAATRTSTTRSPACRRSRRAGADVLYAPGLVSAEEISAVCAAVSKPVNVLALPGGLSVAETSPRRAPSGSASAAQLAWVAVGAAMKAATAIRDDGAFDALRVGRHPRRRCSTGRSRLSRRA